MQWLRSILQSDPSAVRDRDPTLAHQFVEQEDGVLIDVRSSAEFAAGHIGGAHNMPVQSFASFIEKVRKLTAGGKPVVVYCASGMRSGQAKKMLLKAGITNVTNLGSISSW